MGCLTILLAQGLAAQGGYIEGRVLSGDASPQPIVGARVGIWDTECSARTDREGRYRLGPIPAGRFLLRAVYVGHDADERPGTRLADGDTLRVDFVLIGRPTANYGYILDRPNGPPLPPGSVVGRYVAGSTGEPVRRAEVRLERIMVSGRTLHTVTDDSGRYRFRDVPVGSYSVRTFASGFLGIEYETVDVDGDGKEVVMPDRLLYEKRPAYRCTAHASAATGR